MKSAEARTYRSRIRAGHLVSFRAVVKETDLLIHALHPLGQTAVDRILEHRGYLESHIARFPEFATTLDPWPLSVPAPRIVREMAAAGLKAGVGPMAAVAGAIAERVAMDLLAESPSVIVENGGDLFLRIDAPIRVGILAGRSPFSMRIGLEIKPEATPLAVCTSSGTVGHSLSLGRADAAIALARSGALADAAATAIGNRVGSKADIPAAIRFGREIDGLQGVLVIVGDKIGMWGDLQVVPLRPAKKA